MFDDDTEELLKRGDVFYLPPGDSGVVETDLKIIDFNPEKEFGEVMDHIARKMAEMG